MKIQNTDVHAAIENVSNDTTPDIRDVDAARELGATNIYLESNTILEPAINLYHKLGFQKITGQVSPYERTNIHMVLDLAD